MQGMSQMKGELTRKGNRERRQEKRRINGNCNCRDVKMSRQGQGRGEEGIIERKHINKYIHTHKQIYIELVIIFETIVKMRKEMKM